MIAGLNPSKLAQICETKAMCVFPQNRILNNQEILNIIFSLNFTQHLFRVCNAVIIFNSNVLAMINEQCATNKFPKNTTKICMDSKKNGFVDKRPSTH